MGFDIYEVEMNLLISDYSEILKWIELHVGFQRAYYKSSSIFFGWILHSMRIITARGVVSLPLIVSYGEYPCIPLAVLAFTLRSMQNIT